MMHLYFKEVNTNKMYNQTVCVMVVNILLCTPSQLDLLRKKKNLVPLKLGLHFMFICFLLHKNIALAVIAKQNLCRFVDTFRNIIYKVSI